MLLTMVKRNRTLGLPWTRLKVGSPVLLSGDDDGGQRPLSGVVSARNSRCLQVSVADRPEGERFRIDLSADEVTRRRHRQAIFDVLQADGRLGQLRDVMVGVRDPEFLARDNAPLAISDFDSRTALNESQQQAVQFALSAKDLAIIHGPPGTGKTTTVVELVRQITSREEKVLACAPSNAAVDNLLRGFVNAGIRCVRLGHPARVKSDLQPFTLDSMVANHENMRWVKSLLREAEDLFRQASRYTPRQTSQESAA